MFQRSSSLYSRVILLAEGLHFVQRCASSVQIKLTQQTHTRDSRGHAIASQPTAKNKVSSGCTTAPTYLGNMLVSTVFLDAL